jgi:site-specific DNA-cytosine methylase
LSSKRLKVLVACEFSGVVRDAFIKLGHDAVSCDILPTEKEGPHIQDDVLKHLGEGWDLMIAHPPCTYLTLAGNRWFLPKYKERYPNREQQRLDAIEFVKQLYNSKIPRIAIENPLGVLSSVWMQPSQIIQPYWFGVTERKTTCLWLKNLPKLKPTKMVKPKLILCADGKWYSEYHVKTFNIKSGLRGHERSRTFQGIADAMAAQWSNYKPLQLELEALIS